jgi:formate hydrogenlyase transcriptional activator
MGIPIAVVSDRQRFNRPTTETIQGGLISTLRRGGTEIVGESPSLKRVMKQAEVVARTDATVLILGETGTGKELVARAIHNLSVRRNCSFVCTNCSSIPGTLLENELFGHERGAYTGAVAREIGRFELANQGTLFLDEVGDIPLELQSKLLRVLQERELERLGSTRTIQLDFRLVAATNRNLTRMVENSTFRQDLYYRLSVFPIELPPLRQRPEDIPSLVRHFIRVYATALNKRVEIVRSEDMQRLMAYSWPGNVRELQNVIERCVILSQNEFLYRPRFPSPPRAEEAPLFGSQTLAECERVHILKTLEYTDWVVAGPNGAAARLGVKRTTLLDKMRRLGISRPRN